MHEFADLIIYFWMFLLSVIFYVEMTKLREELRINQDMVRCLVDNMIRMHQELMEHRYQIDYYTGVVDTIIEEHDEEESPDYGLEVKSDAMRSVLEI